MKYYRLYSPHYEADQTITEQKKAGVSPNKQKALLPEKKKKKERSQTRCLKIPENQKICFDVLVYFSLNSLS